MLCAFNLGKIRNTQMQKLKLTPLGKNAIILKDFFDRSPVSFCDLTVGTKYLWRDTFKIQYQIVDNTLIIAESCKDYDLAFYYPIGDDVSLALEMIEEYCKENAVPLKFCCIDNERAAELIKRYPLVDVYNLREWSDYIYDANAFKTFSGKKYSGQRNHVNKFKKLYPDYEFCALSQNDLIQVKAFLDEYERGAVLNLWSAVEEAKNVYDMIENSFSLNQKCGIIKVQGKIVALAVGEVVNDTLVVHVEKALKTYQGAYPMMASEFAKAFATEGVKYINREEDCGDIGLRTSKLQYHPVLIKEKNIVLAKTLFERLPSTLSLCTERLTITEIKPCDKTRYKELYVDDQLNKFWGYDYRQDLLGQTPDEDYFFNFQRRLKEKKEEFSFAVRLNDELIGELVLHNFGFDLSVEMGFRFFRSYQGKGYAFESAQKLKEWVIENLCPTVIKSRCFKQNLPSKNLIAKLGLKKYKQDQTHYYFCQKVVSQD